MGLKESKKLNSLLCRMGDGRMEGLDCSCGIKNQLEQLQATSVEQKQTVKMLKRPF